ncbi:MAG: tRNA glutamyl-Q(34) synthetase GluQRS [Phycisphaerae bacterium]|nr:tRNA glutamyl-Q(34) synthetase GluQRS [Phycisphaerae bacterium]
MAAREGVQFRDSPMGVRTEKSADGGAHPVLRTRLAPSPTGALHLGNARTFLINWALAKQRGWRIVLRIEDLDTPRVKPGATEGVYRTLEALGLLWDEGPIVQSDDLEPYRRAMEKLAAAGKVYPSSHSRGEIDDAGASALSAPQEGARESVFPASSRPVVFPMQFESGGGEENWRFATPDEAVEFEDGFAGGQSHRPAETVGDFVVWTKRAQPSYQLAVVVDDARQGITHIVRGNDLLDSAARQRLLMPALGIEHPPSYLHLPLVRGEDGKRLAKRHGDTRIDSYLAAGVHPHRVIALLARWSGLSGDAEAMTAEEFARAFDLSRVPKCDVVFTPRDDRWLKQKMVKGREV